MNDILGGLGLPANLAAAVWLIYGGAKLWQLLRNGKPATPDGVLAKTMDTQLAKLNEAVVAAIKEQGALQRSQMDDAMSLLQAQAELWIVKAAGRAER